MIHIHTVLEFTLLPLLFGYLLSSILTLWNWRQHGKAAWGIVFKSEVRVFELWPKAIGITVLVWLVCLVSKFLSGVELVW
jgi:hypothetical protein